MEPSASDAKSSASPVWIKRSFPPALLLLIAAFFCAWPVLRGMATTSLWNDEIFSISRYSAKGPIYTLSTYHQPNNHILFNFINSITPGGDRYAPVRARFWSYLFTALSCFIMVGYSAKAGQLFAGCVQVFFFLANLNYLDLVLQGRGYGLLALAAIVCTVLTWDYLRRPSLRSLIGIPLAVWLGTWSVPTYVLFGGSLLLVLLYYTRDWRWLPAGAATLAAICVVYWPVYSELVRASTNYGAEWGKAFKDWSAVGDIFSTYLVFGGHSWVAFLVVAAVVLVLLPGRLETPGERAALCLGLAVLLTLTVALKMETPMKRTIAFVVVPFAFVMATALGKLMRAPGFPRLRSPIMYGMAVIALFYGVHISLTFRFVPYEAWLETARAIEEGFPKGTAVFAPFRPDWLKTYLSADYPLTTQADPARMVAGQQIVVDSAFVPAQRVRPDQLPKGYKVFLVPQRRGKYQKIYSWPAKQG